MAGRGFGPLGADVDLELVDPQAPWHSGAWRLSVAEGKGSLTPGGSGAVRLGPRGLSAVFTGYAGAQALRSAGLAEGDDAALERGAALFAGPTPWMLDDF